MKGTFQVIVTLFYKLTKKPIPMQYMENTVNFMIITMLSGLVGSKSLFLA